ncbi:MAG: putative anti-sigma regulatory factor, serine/threonine protein kinase [Solirubrobacterales bacterium]|nr:putative anti-sigma regulatory factor, serine/threonine protein kinase [Solirubrobacterales bacterium]
MSAGVRLILPALPENVAVVRQALAGMTDALGVDPALGADMKIAVTEACANAVIHAYDDEKGPLEVDMVAEGALLTVSVRDRGLGFKPLPADDEHGPLGFGLALIASLSDAFAIQGGAGGTEVVMSFEIGDVPNGPLRPPTGQLDEDRPAPLPGLLLLRVSAGPLAAPVLGRVVSLLAARVDFSIDRLSDAQIVSDALAAHSAEHALDGHVAVAVTETDRMLELRVGPLRPGGGDELVEATEVPGLGRLLEQLADELTVEPAGLNGQDGELLRLRLAEAP